MKTRPPTVLRIESEVLRGNPLGDPVDRDLYVHVPADHDPKDALVALVALAGFTGNGAMLFNADPLGDRIGDRVDRLVASGACPPVMIVAPDCFTRLGGNQYIDSSATGAYERYIVDDGPSPSSRSDSPFARWGVFGKSSGGYGAIVLGMRNPRLFQAVGDHSGDANFELCYTADGAECLDQVRAAGGVKAWLDAYWAAPQRRRGGQVKTLNFLAMAAHYSPNPAAELGFDLPFDLATGKFREDVWAKWKAWDPVRMVPSHADALRALRLVYVDCGTKDEYALHWGARALVAELRAIGVEPIHEEFDDGHMNVPYRFEREHPAPRASSSSGSAPHTA